MLRKLLASGLLGMGLTVSVPAGAGDMHPVSMIRYTNQPLDGAFGRAGTGNNLARLPKGEQKLGDTTFKVGEGMLQLGSKILEKFPDRINGIAVDRACAKVHFLHATFYGGAGKPKLQVDPAIFIDDGTQIGEYVIHYDNDSTEGVPIIYGRDVRDWWYYPDSSLPPTVGKVAWAGENDVSELYTQGVRVYSSVWKNPYPDRKIKTIDFVGRKEDCIAAPFCVAITLEDKDTPVEKPAIEKPAVEKPAEKAPVEKPAKPD